MARIIPLYIFLLVCPLFSLASEKEVVKQDYVKGFGYEEFNFNFEQLDSNNSPNYWLLKGDHSKPVTDEKNKQGGERALFLSTLEAENQQPSSFIYQSMDVGFPVSRVNLSGFVKFEPATPQSQFTLILTVYDKAKTDAQLKYVSYQVDKTIDWETLTLTLPVKTEAQFISITGYLQGKGQLWLDELHFNFK